MPRCSMHEVRRRTYYACRIVHLSNDCNRLDSSANSATATLTNLYKQNPTWLQLAPKALDDAVVDGSAGRTTWGM